MTKPCKYDNIQGLLVKRISHCSKKGPNFSKLQQEDFDTLFRIKNFNSESKPQLPKYDPLLVNPLRKLYWSRNYVYEKESLLQLNFQRNPFIVNLWYCKEFHSIWRKKPELFYLSRPASPIPFQPQNDPTCPRNISMYFTCKILTFFAVELNRFSINYSFHKRIIRKIWLKSF